MYIACGTLFRHILKEVRVCFSSYVCSKKNCLHLDVETRIQPFLFFFSFFLFSPYMSGFWSLKYSPLPPGSYELKTLLCVHQC